MSGNGRLKWLITCLYTLLSCVYHTKNDRYTHFHYICIMKYIFTFLFFYVTIVHFIVRGIGVYLADVKGDMALSYFRVNKNELGYFGWEMKGVIAIYLLPYIAFIADLGNFPNTFCYFLCIIIAFLRSVEHIHPKFLD